MVGKVFTSALSTTGLGGTVVLIIGIIGIVLKNREDGRSWLKKKFGNSWEEKILIRFWGWPMIILGVIMWIPDNFWFDVGKFFIGLGIFVGITFFQKRNQKNQSKQEPVDDVAAS